MGARLRNPASRNIEGLITWIFFGTFIGARMYLVVQNDIGAYIAEPWRILALWEGGLAFFGGLFGAMLGAFLYARRHGLPFARLADLFAPAVPIGAHRTHPLRPG